YLPQMAQLRNPRHLKALVAGCASWGARLRPGCPAVAVEQRGARVVAVRTAEGRVEAGKVLLAAGAWTDPLLEQVGWRPGVRPGCRSWGRSRGWITSSSPPATSAPGSSSPRGPAW